MESWNNKGRLREAYLQSYQTSKMEILQKFAESSILDVWQSSEYAPYYIEKSCIYSVSKLFYVVSKLCSTPELELFHMLKWLSLQHNSIHEN